MDCAIVLPPDSSELSKEFMPSAIVPTPAAAGAPAFQAILKKEPDDFVVNELLRVDFDGKGEHLYLQIRKVGMNTDEVLKQLEGACGVGSADIGVAGLKDRHANTTQWISVRTPMSEAQCRAHLDILQTQNKQLSVVQTARHSRKLRRGAHSGNDFVVTLRSLSAVASDAVALSAVVDERLRVIDQEGFPNYVGPQRFGWGGQNLVRARQWFRQPRKRASRQQRSLWLSAARSALFNAVCAHRVGDNNWQYLLQGEPAILNGTHSFFDSATADTAELQRRLKSFDIHPSGPQWGRGLSVASGDCAELERTVLEPYADLCAGLENAGMNQERRALRAQAQQLEHHWLDAATLQLRFRLLPGVFATTLLNELGLCKEPDRQTNQRT